MEIQIDMPSQAQFGMCPSYKRRRSPSSSSIPEDRPNKRLGLILDSTVSSRAGSEDWVHSSNFTGLRLNSSSPNISSFEQRATEIMRIPVKQEDMAMEGVDAEETFIHPQHFQPHQPVIPSQMSVSVTYENSLFPGTFTSHSDALQPSENAEALSPHINLIPPTPQHAHPQMPQIQAPSTQFTRRSPSEVQLNPSRKTSKTPTMGPRLDCEKCQMRVPGHWMHYD